MYHLKRFCNILAGLRREKGWTQTDLAEKLNVSPQAVSRWESGIGYPDVTMFPSIAEVFSIPIGVLFGEEKAKQTTEETKMTPSTRGIWRSWHIFCGNTPMKKWISRRSC